MNQVDPRIGPIFPVKGRGHFHGVPFWLGRVQLPVLSERDPDELEELGPEGGLVERAEEILHDGFDEESPTRLVVVFDEPGPVLVGVVEVLSFWAP